MIVNFKICEITRGIHKLVKTPTLIIIIIIIIIIKVVFLLTLLIICTFFIFQKNNKREQYKGEQLRIEQGFVDVCFVILMHQTRYNRKT